MTPEDPYGVLRAVREDLDWATLDAYAKELERWNRSIRLVGPKRLDGIRVQIADALLPFLLARPGFPLLDIGSGAGLPGIPLAIAFRPALSSLPVDSFSSASLVCLEAQAKRVSFLRHVVRELGLRGVRVVEGRAETSFLEDPSLAGAFATVTGRAVADPEHLLRLARPFLAPRGQVLLPRGEAAAPAIHGWRRILDREYEGPAGLGRRRIVSYARA